MLLLALRLFWRDFRSGELRVLFIALAIAVAGVTSVGFFADRVRAGLALNARDLIGADLVLISDHPIADDYLAEAARLGLKQAETRSFPSMVRAGERLQLADIKAVSPDYPLRGQLEADGREARGGPPPGTVWLEKRLEEALGASLGGRVAIGQREFVFSARLTNEPDRAFSFFSMAPHAMLALSDLEGTGLIGPGARISYRLLLAGEDKRVADFKRWIEPRLARGERLEDAGNSRPEVRNALDRADRFLGLSTVLTLVLSAVAVALATRRHFQRHLDACAVMRCLGLTQWRLLGMHAVQFLMLALLAIAVGSVLGYATHFLLIRLLVGDLGNLPAAGSLPLVQGALAALVLLTGFSGPPLLQLARVPTLRVLRREFQLVQPGFLLGQSVGLALLGAVAVLMAQDIRLGLLVFGGFLLVAGVLVLLSHGLIRVLVRASLLFAGGIWRQGMANLQRHARRASLLVVALTIGFTAILLLTVIRHAILGQWQSELPADAPNTFIINIQPEQRDALAARLQESGVRAELSPMIRARLLKIDGQPVSGARFADDERASRLVEREFNLSWQEKLQVGNEIVAGQWFTSASRGQPEASVEEGLAKTLGIRIGNSLSFMIDGEEKAFRVTSLRKLSWGSMRVNFFVVMPPGVIEEAQSSYITSFFIPPQAAGLGAQLVQAFSNLTLIDIGEVLGQVRGVIERIAGSVELIFLFTLLAGAVVLEAAMWASLDERRHEFAVMRALGASQRYLRGVLLVELAAVGGLAGMLASACAMLMGHLISQRFFDLALSPDLWLLALAIPIGALFSLLAGYWTTRKVLNTPPTKVLATT